ncbi:hypothetical protein [Pseudomonas sp. TWI929]|uniref:hypothetical protein n=1 Tax=Pseudomonas sp. TWI929 TaxID=3136795 RepID=UPI00320A5088
MKFVIKDLMITVLPLVDKFHLPQGECDAGPKSCASPSAGSCGGGSPCSCGGTQGPDWSEVFDPPYLIRMKEQLRLQIAQIEAQEQAVRKALQPNKEQVRLLEPYLEDAMREMKKEMKKDTE